jgi:hypothetical protein
VPRSATPSPSANCATAYDNFTLGASYDINRFAWVGGYLHPATRDYQMYLTFLGDAGNPPETVLAT